MNKAPASTIPNGLLQATNPILHQQPAQPRRAKEAIGWEAKVGFEEGMKRTIEWFKIRATWRSAN